MMHAQIGCETKTVQLGEKESAKQNKIYQRTTTKSSHEMSFFPITTICNKRFTQRAYNCSFQSGEADNGCFRLHAFRSILELVIVDAQFNYTKRDKFRRYN